jgi:hypothetical protein
MRGVVRCARARKEAANRSCHSILEFNRAAIVEMSLEMLPAFVIGALCSGVAMFYYMRQESGKRASLQQGRRVSNSQVTIDEQNEKIKVVHLVQFALISKRLEKAKDESAAKVLELQDGLQVLID